MFQGFPEETVRFFLDLRFHNEVTWFHDHRSEYESFIRTPFRELIEAMSPELQRMFPDFELRPARAVARINRDIRFTRDKSPYRDHLWILFRRANEPREGAPMYWFELSPEQVEWGLGSWGANRAATDVIREWIRTKPDEVRKALKKCAFGKKDDPLILSLDERYRSLKPPPGLTPDLAALYPVRTLSVIRQEELSAIYKPELPEMILNDYERLAPLYRLMRAAADEGKSRLQG